MSFGLADPFLSSIVVAASQSLVGSGYQLVVMMAQDDEAHAQVARQVRAGRMDGVMLVSVHAQDPLPLQLVRAKVPMVMGGRPGSPLGGGHWVDVDNVGGGLLAANRLIGTGRRRIAIITGPPDMTAATDRLTGFRAGLSDAGIPLDSMAVGQFTKESGERAMREILARSPQVEAVFAASDLMALGAIKVLREFGRRVPGDVAVIGFDDVVLAENADPPLTTIRQPSAEYGRAMVQLLLRQLKGQSVQEQRLLPVELIVRSSG